MQEAVCRPVQCSGDATKALKAATETGGSWSSLTVRHRAIKNIGGEKMGPGREGGGGGVSRAEGTTA